MSTVPAVLPRRLVLTCAAVGALLGPGAAVAGAAPVSVFPTPGTLVASDRTQVSFRGAAPGALGRIRVSGSRSGAHPGVLRAHSDGQGASFVPRRGFRPGERVTVRTGLDVRGGRGGDFGFTVGRLVARAQPVGPEPPPPPGRGRVDRFLSRSDLRPAGVSILRREPGRAPGLIFLAPKSGPAQDGPMIVDDNGDLVWFKPMRRGIRATDFRAQTLDGRPVLTWWEGRVGFGNGAGEGVIYDGRYEPVRRVRAGNGYAADLHDFVLSPQGTALLLVYQPVRRDLRSVGGPRNGLVVDNIVQEIDIKTGLVLYEWHSLGEIGLNDAYLPLPEQAGAPWDYFHINSVEVDPRDGNLVISARHTWAIYKLSRSTGALVWTLGGKESDFRLGAGTRVAWQHDARVLPDGSISIFDNAAAPPIRKRSRWINVALDQQRKRARLTRSVSHVRGLLSANQGGAQPLPTGGGFVGWGSQPFFSEYAANGRSVLEGRIAKGHDNYRAYRFPWSGRPVSRPRFKARSASGGRVVADASWNGATDVARWEVLAGASEAALAPTGAAPRSGFETRIVAGSGAFVAVRALDAAGRVLGTSAAVRPRSG